MSVPNIPAPHQWLPTETLPEPHGVLVMALVGLLLLLAGRRLAWLALLAVGAVGGFILASRLPLPAVGEGAVDGQALTWVIAGLGALVGVLLALFVKRVAVGVAGFAGGALGVVALLPLLAPAFGEPTASWLAANLWAPVLVGGILGAALAAWLVEAAMIVVTSVLGAQMVTAAIPLATQRETPALIALAWIVLALLGIAIQARSWAKD
ncbi:MAG: hypothetical protein AAGD01_00145 [Acidobacteriota bacterium]